MVAYEHKLYLMSRDIQYTAYIQFGHLRIPLIGCWNLWHGSHAFLFECTEWSGVRMRPVDCLKNYAAVQDARRIKLIIMLACDSSGRLSFVHPHCQKR